MNIVICIVFVLLSALYSREVMIARKRAVAYMEEGVKTSHLAYDNLIAITENLQKEEDSNSLDRPQLPLKLILGQLLNGCLPQNLLASQSAAEHARANTMAMAALFSTFAALLSFYLIP